MPNDPNLEWLGHVQPVGLVVAPSVLSENGLVPAEQSRADTDEFSALLTETGPAISDPWQVASEILGWPVNQVSGAPGGPALPDDGLRVFVPEAETELTPDWAVSKPGGGWQLLVQRLPMGIEPDRRGALQGWEATSHQRLERLLRETGVQTGLLISDDSWRLVHAPRGETSGQITFPVRPMGTVSGRPMLGGFKLLLDRSRLFTDAPNKRLPAILTASRDAQAAVSTALAGQVLGALHELLRGLHAADPDRLTRLAQQRPQEVYEGLLTVLLRLIFLLYAEDRDLVPSRSDAAARALYHRSYGIRGLHARLRRDSARNPDTMNERYGAWGQMLATFKLVHTGDGSGWIRGRGGNLFDPSRFAFLQGRDNPGDRIVIPRISDGAILRVLDGLMVLNGERLSYRTLDVEQIGSVYETVMGFAVLPAPGPVLAIRAGKNNRTPVFVNLAALTALRGKDRIKTLKEEYSRSQLSAAHSRAVEGATSAAQMAEALRPIVDERGSPGSVVVQPGTPILQPTDERRRTGSHYTPRSLTEPIVRHALEPAFERIGADATPDAVLALKVCDPAMGSGAFLVEACRQLATRLIAAWARFPEQRPPIPADEDEDLLARRLVAQRCLYGVDRNPLATDLARLSLWLATLARDHEFTFLDHALKSGDSLVGLTARQITALTWGDDRQSSFFGNLVAERVERVVQGRSAIRDAPDDVARAIQEATHATIEATLVDVRDLGDAVLSCFFGEAKTSQRQIALHALQDLGGRGDEEKWRGIRIRAAMLGQGTHPLRPFHWPLEFPEVFTATTCGFDAIVGNPPFLGGKRISAEHGTRFADWLQTLHKGAHGNADLVAHFFRRGFELLRIGGCLGLIATNTIGQGDTRESGLRAILEAGGSITHTIRRLPWPGEAAVVVSVVHILRGIAHDVVLDGRPVRRVSAYLVEGDLDSSPVPLVANAHKAFVGTFLLGLGFTFDSEAAAKGKASPVEEMHRLIAKDPRNAERIFPYLGGEEVNTDPRHAHRRWCIDFNDYPLRRETMARAWEAMDERERTRCRTQGIVPNDYPGPVAADWPDLLQIVRRLVKPERDQQKRDALRERWWQFADKRPGLRAAVAGLDVVLASTQTSAHLVISWLPAGVVYDQSLTLLPTTDVAEFLVRQSRIQELWTRELGATLEDRLRFTAADSGAPFPLPSEVRLNPISAKSYHDHRAALMIARNEGLTKTYNRFHDSAEHAPDIQRLRDLHHDMDVAVLRAYGWDDLADIAAPEFLTEDTEQDHRYQGRLFWPALFRDEVLARLLALNGQRAAEERAAGITPIRPTAVADADLTEVES